MIIRSELKNQAKEQIRGNIGILFVCNLIFLAICVGVGLVPIVGSVITIIASPAFMVSLAMIYLALAEGKKPEIADIFKGFNVFVKALCLYLLVVIFTTLWSLLLIVPGIIKSISYSMSFYIMAEHPEMTAMEALKESQRIMNGHKMEYFVLALSFILWGLLCSVTLGIAGIYVAPYMQATMVNFYNKIKQAPSSTLIGDGAEGI